MTVVSESVSVRTKREELHFYTHIYTGCSIELVRELLEIIVEARA